MNIKKISLVKPLKTLLAKKPFEVVNPDKYVEVGSFRQFTREKIESVKPMIANYAKHEDVFVSFEPQMTYIEMVEQDRAKMLRDNSVINVNVRDLKTGKVSDGSISNKFNYNDKEENGEFVRSLYQSVVSRVKSLRE